MGFNSGFKGLRMNAPPKSLESITPSQIVISQNNDLIDMKKRTVCLLRAPPIFAWLLQPGRGSVSLDPILPRNVPSASFPSLLTVTTPTVEWLTDIQTLHSLEENCALPGYYIACSGNLLRTLRDNLSVPRRISWPLNMGPIAYPETSVRNYYYTPCNDSEERSSHPLQGASLKSHIWHSSVQFSSVHTTYCVRLFTWRIQYNRTGKL